MFWDEPRLGAGIRLGHSVAKGSSFFQSSSSKVYQHMVICSRKVYTVVKWAVDPSDVDLPVMVKNCSYNS